MGIEVDEKEEESKFKREECSKLLYAPADRSLRHACLCLCNT